MSAAADQVQAASVDAQQAASDEARLRRLLADGSVGAADHERQKARADAAAARLEQARRQLDLARHRDGYSTLVAPYARVITPLRFEPGPVVTAWVRGSGRAGVGGLNDKGSGLVFAPVEVVSNGAASVRVTGLAVGSRVVSVGAQKLDAASAVRAIERAPEAAPTATVDKSSS